MSENPSSNPPSAAPATPPNSGPAAPATAPKEAGQTRPRLSSPLSLISITVVLAAILFVVLIYVLDAWTHESTDDAFIAGHVVSIAPRVAGQVIAVHVLDNQIVHSNDLLVELDPADFDKRMAQKKAAQESEDSSYKAAIAGYELMGVKVKTAEADAQSSKADVAAAEAAEVRAKADFERAQALIKDQTISAQEFDQTKAAAAQAEADLTAAKQKALSDESKVNEANAQKQAVWAEAGSVLAQFNEAGTSLDSAKLDLSYTKIYAPGDGRVTRKQVEPGDYLDVGEQVMSLVPAEVWVIANFKETQLKDMQSNQPVVVEIDALNGRKFRAHVDSVQAGSGAQFSLLPPENATGNFVKVVQRVPVKIVFDEALPKDHTIGPGLSVTPSVQVNTFTLATWVLAAAAIVLAIILVALLRLLLNRK